MKRMIRRLLFNSGKMIRLSGVRPSLTVFAMFLATLINVRHIGYVAGSFAGFYFTIEPKSLIVSPASPAALHCEVTSKDLPSVPEIVWIKDGVRLISTTSRSVLSNGTLYFSTTSSDKSDEGIYQCKAEVRGLGTIVSRKALLQLLSDVTFIEEPYGMKLHPGDVAVMLCQLTGLVHPMVVWYRQEEKLDATNSQYVFHNDGALEISSLQTSDFGNYKCVVEDGNYGPYQSSVAHIAVDEDRAANHKVPPRFIMKPRDKLAIENSTVVLHCAANGRDRKGAQPKITWLKDGSTLDGFLNPANRLSLVGSGSLKITQIQEDDSGLYTCRASNLEESIDADVFVTVQVPPTVVQSPLSTVGRVSSDVELNCSVRGNPKPLVQWIKDGDVIVQDDYFQMVDGNNLRILGLVATDAGMFQCLATNAIGSAQTTAQLVVKPLGVIISNVTGAPSAPTNLQVMVISTRFVTLSWAAPDHSGFSDVIEYSIFWKEDSSVRERILNTSVLEVDVQHLKPSTKYHFRVVAWNLQGPSQVSAQTTLEMQPEALVPDAPNDLQAVALSPTSIRLSWNSPVNTNGPIITFKVHYFCVGDIFGENDINVLENEYTFTELRKFQKYLFRVVAYNSNGPGMATEDVTCHTFSDVPAQPPQNVSVEAATSTSIVVRWEAPPDDALNGIITGYKIRYKQRGDKVGETVTCDGVRRMYDLTDLSKGTEYSVRVQAINSNGTGPSSQWMMVETYANDLDETVLPGQPISLRARPLTNSIVVSWNFPKDHMILIRGFILGYGVGIPDVFRQILDAKQRSHTIKGLKAASEYVISLKAFNNVGEGRPAYETTQTLELTTHEPVTPMLPPVGVKAIVLSATTIVLSWTDSTLGRNQRVVDNRHYVIRYNPKLSRKPKTINSTELNVYLEDLKPDTEYEFSIKIIKGQRQSTWSLSVFNRTKESAPATAPRDLTLSQVTDQPTWISLTWQPPRQMNGQVTGYLVFYTTDATQPDGDWMFERVVGDKVTLTITSLASQSTYYFKVQARNSVGYGPLSPTVIFRMPNADGSGGGMLLSDDDPKQVKINKDSVRDASGVAPGVLWAVVGIVGTVAVIAIAAVFAVVFIRRKKDPNVEQPNASSSTSKSGSNALKPPDLWIHDKVEMNRLSRNSINSSTLTDPSAIPLDGLEMDDSVSVDLQDAAAFRNRRNPGGICPMMISIDNPPPLPRDPLGSLLPSGFMSASDASYSIGGIRPLFSRSQFSNPPRVNAGDIHQQQMADYTMSTLERHRARNDNSRKLLGSNPRLTVRPMQLQGLSSNLSNSSSTSSSVTAASTIIPPTCITRGPLAGLSANSCSPDATIRSNDSSELTKSVSTEELTAEMANIEGLMKDLNAITQHEFHC